MKKRRTVHIVLKKSRHRHGIRKLLSGAFGGRPHFLLEEHGSSIARLNGR